MKLARLSILLTLGCGFGCKSASPPAASAPVFPKPKIASNSVSCVDPNLLEPALLWNGRIGVRIGRDGTGTGLPFFDIQDYQLAGEEKINALPNPLYAKFKADGVALDPKVGTHYEQTLDFDSGLLTTGWTQKVKGKSLAIGVRSVIDPEFAIVGDEWEFTSSDDFAIDGEIVTPEIKNGSSPKKGLVNDIVSQWPTRRVLTHGVIRGVQLSQSGKTYTAHLACSGGKGATINRVFSFGPNPYLGSHGQEPPTFTFAEVVKRSAANWKQRWRTDIVLDGPIEDQQAIRSMLFSLRSSIGPDESMSVSPMGLSSSQYNGHVFWDADIWVFPALAFIDPQSAKRIADYRLWTLQRAKANYSKWVFDGTLTSTGKVRGYGSNGGAKYAWESSVTGKETVPGPSKFEDHISGDVAFNSWRASALGLVKPEEANAVISAVGKFFEARSEKNADGLFEIKGVMSPDENHVGDNDLYTNLLAEWCVNGGKWPTKPTYKLPSENGHLRTYDGDMMRGYKQAAAVLAAYPLQFPGADPRVLMETFSDKAIKNGPAMTDSVHALIWARLGDTDKAYAAWHESWKPFTTSPLLMFSEKRSKPLTYFTTGAGGSIQAVIYGFLGFRIDDHAIAGAAWTRKLANGGWLSISPNLPSAWKSVKFTGVHVLGKTYDMTFTGKTVKVSKAN